MKSGRRGHTDEVLPRAAALLTHPHALSLSRRQAARVWLITCVILIWVSRPGAGPCGCSSRFCCVVSKQATVLLIKALPDCCSQPHTAGLYCSYQGNNKNQVKSSVWIRVVLIYYQSWFSIMREEMNKRDINWEQKPSDVVTYRCCFSN